MNEATKGLWRDGKFAVLDRRGFDLGARCLFTGEELTGEEMLVEFAGPSDDNPQGVKRVKLNMPVARSWQGMAVQGKRRVGKWIFRISGVIFLVGAAGVCVLFSIPSLMSTVGPVAIGIATVGLIGSIVGLAWPHLDGVPGPGGSVQAGWITEGQIFVREPHVSVLQSLPRWTGESRFKTSGQYQRFVGWSLYGAGALFILLGLLITPLSVYTWMQASGSANWPTAAGTIVNSHMSEHQVYQRRVGTRTQYRVEVQYQYQASGSTLIGSRVGYSEDLTFGDRQQAMASRDRYQPGTKVAVYYHPSDPTFSLIEPGAKFVDQLFPIIMAGVTLLGVALFMGGRHLVRASRTAEAEAVT